MPATHRRGLLRGVVDTDLDSSTFYADTIDTSKEGLAWLNERGLMWEAAVEDAKGKGVPVKEYIASIDANMEKFALSDTIYGRKQHLLALRDTFTSVGQFSLLLGGRSVGKSYILQTLKNQYNSASDAFGAESETKPPLVLYVDGRREALDLGLGLATEIAKLTLEGVVSMPDEVDWSILLQQVGRGVIEATVQNIFAKVGIDASNTIQQAIKPIADVLFAPFTNVDVQLDLLDIFVQLAESKNAYPVVVIDEANVVLGDEIEATKWILLYFVSRTKQNNELSLILVSSEHAYPYQLERQGFNLQNVTWRIFAGEIPPSDMRKLMVDATYEQGDNRGDTIIGMGPRLAELCLAAYGGHFLTVKNAIAVLSQQESQFEASSLLPVLKANIFECLETYMSSWPLLAAMAKSGFAPIERRASAVVDLIAKLNIGGVVSIESTICGLSATKWDRTTCTYALIPSSESVRFVIAMTLDALGLFWRLRLFFRKFRT
jgi:hypothetical protein